MASFDPENDELGLDLRRPPTAQTWPSTAGTVAHQPFPTFKR